MWLLILFMPIIIPIQIFNFIRWFLTEDLSDDELKYLTRKAAENRENNWRETL